MNTEQLNQAFLDMFGQEADATFFSPGRINLIGEHTDYNGGHVFPRLLPWEPTGLANVMTKFCAFILLTLKNLGLSKWI